jgi:hypothetical protein
MHTYFLNIVFAHINHGTMSKNDIQLICILPGAVLFTIGVIMKYFTPNNASMWYGYRTPFSEKNDQTRKEANSYSANIGIVTGILNGIVWGYLAYKFGDNPDNTIIATIGVPTLIGSALALVILTELHLRKIFDKEGNRRKELDGLSG